MVDSLSPLGWGTKFNEDWLEEGVGCSGEYLVCWDWFGEKTVSWFCNGWMVSFKQKVLHIVFECVSKRNRRSWNSKMRWMFPLRNSGIPITSESGLLPKIGWFRVSIPSLEHFMGGIPFPGHLNWGWVISPLPLQGSCVRSSNRNKFQVAKL